MKFLLKQFALILIAGIVMKSGLFAQTKEYNLHKNITVTVFWVGESGVCRNSDSAWDDKWKEHFGGNDHPVLRNGYFPKGFIPKENPFYCALPYRDYASRFSMKPTALEKIPWAKEKKWALGESICKNRWLKILKNGKAVYAQWEDVGPFETDDWKYVFGNAAPKNSHNHRAGLDVSPAVRDYLALMDMDKVEWQFVDSEDVPDGPWKKIITSSQISWN